MQLASQEKRSERVKAGGDHSMILIPRHTSLPTLTRERESVNSIKNLALKSKFDNKSGSQRPSIGMRKKNPWRMLVQDKRKKIESTVSPDENDKDIIGSFISKVVEKAPKAPNYAGIREMRRHLTNIMNLEDMHKEDGYTDDSGLPPRHPRFATLNRNINSTSSKVLPPISRSSV